MSNLVKRSSNPLCSFSDAADISRILSSRGYSIDTEVGILVDIIGNYREDPRSALSAMRALNDLRSRASDIIEARFTMNHRGRSSFTTSVIRRNLPRDVLVSNTPSEQFSEMIDIDNVLDIGDRDIYERNDKKSKKEVATPKATSSRPPNRGSVSGLAG